MGISIKLKKFLEQNKVGFEVLQHPLAYSAMESAGSVHISGKQLIKSVIVKADGDFLMCVLPAIHLVDFDKLKQVVKAKDVQLAKEQEISKLFPEYPIGAEPPFGNLYGLKVYMDKDIQDHDEIVFNAGTHTDMVKMKYKDFQRLVQPIIADIGVHV